MARTREQLQTELVSRIGDDTIDTDQSNSWLQASWIECIDYHPAGWPFLKNSATGTLASSTSSQTFSSIFGVSDFGMMDQLLVNNSLYVRIGYTDKDVQGQYGVYAITPDLTGLVLPGADGGPAILKYTKDVQPIAAGQTVIAPTSTTTAVPSQFSSQFEEAVIAGAATRYFQNSLKPGLADYWQSQRDFYLDNIIDANIKLSFTDVVRSASPFYNEIGTREF